MCDADAMAHQHSVYRLGVTNTAAARELSLLMVVLSADDVLDLYVCLCAQGEPPALEEANAPYICVCLRQLMCRHA